MDIYVMVGIGCAILIMLIGIILLLRRPSTPDTHHETAAVPPLNLPETTTGTPGHLSDSATSLESLQQTLGEAMSRPSHQKTEEEHRQDSAIYHQLFGQPSLSAVPVEEPAAPETQPEAEDDIFPPQTARGHEVLMAAPVEAGLEDTSLTAEPEDDLLEAVNRLDNATAHALPAIDTQPIPPWSGHSPLIEHHQRTLAAQDEETSLKKASHVIVMYLLPSNYRALDGDKVLAQLKQYGLRYGEMSLFHRYEEASGQGPLMFSVLKYTPDGPQGFDLEEVAAEQLQGLAFFLAIPHEKALSGFDMMSSIASLLGRDFAAKLYDEEMNPWSRERKDYYRQKVIHLAQE